MNALVERVTLSFGRFASGALFVLGAVGLFRTHFDGFADSAGIPLLTFTVNPLMNVVHLAAGGAGIVMTRTPGGAARYARVLGFAAVPFGLLEFVVGDSSSDIFGRDTGLAVCHIALGVAGVALWAWSRRVTPATLS